MDKLHNDPNRAAEDVVDQAREQYSDGDFKIFRYRFVQEAEKGKKGDGA